VRRKTRQSDHVLGKIKYFDGPAHVEDKYFTAFTQRTGLHHELRCLRNGHKVTRHVRVGYGYGLAIADLVAKDRNNRSGRAQDVPETNRDIICRIKLVEGLHDDLGYSF